MIGTKCIEAAVDRLPQLPNSHWRRSIQCIEAAVDRLPQPLRRRKGWLL